MKHSLLEFHHNEIGASSSVADITTAMTAGAIVATVVTVTGNTVVLDIEELAHVKNAQAMVDAAQAIVNETNSGPVLNGFKEISLTEIYVADKLQETPDPSGEDAKYHADNSKVRIEKVEDANSDRSIDKYYVILRSNADDYSYVDEVNKAAGTKTDGKELSRDNILIPKRDSDGW
jgi:hypothetical protein